MSLTAPHTADHIDGRNTCRLHFSTDMGDQHTRKVSGSDNYILLDMSNKKPIVEQTSVF